MTQKNEAGGQECRAGFIYSRMRRKSGSMFNRTAQPTHSYGRFHGIEGSTIGGDSDRSRTGELDENSAVQQDSGPRP
jgi:hypothetical protein